VTGRALPTGSRLLEDERFVWEHVWPRLSRDGDNAPQSVNLELTMHRSPRGRRHAVAEYAFDGSANVVAKLYPNSDEGHAAYSIVTSLWRQGFGPHSPYQVPEPIAYLPELGVLLMRKARGQGLSGLAIDTEAFKKGVQRAARWLGALHISALRLGPVEDRLRSAFRLSRRVAIASKRRPDLEELFRRALEELAARGAKVPEPRRLAQTHRRYHAERVFVATDCVTAVGLDRLAVADPMKDVGEFVHRLRWDSANARMREAHIDKLTDAFLGEYARCGSADFSALAYQWSYSVLWTLLGVASSQREVTEDREEWSELLQEEFRSIPRLVAS
jgi:hypothetical protein